MTDWSPWLERPQLERARAGDVEIRPGDHVRLWPLGRADILDLALEGKTATVEAIEQDFEDRVYLAVVLDDDPGRDLGELRQPGHRFFFGVEEVELLDGGRDLAQTSSHSVRWSEHSDEAIHSEPQDGDESTGTANATAQPQQPRANREAG